MVSRTVFCLFWLGCLAFTLAEEETSTERKKPLYKFPNIPVNSYLVLNFNSSADLHNRLVLSSAKKDGADEAIAKYDGTWAVEVHYGSAIDGDYSLVMKSKAKHHAISMALDRPIKFDTPELVVQYEVKFAEGIECGGAYIKLLSQSPKLQLVDFNDKMPYTIMFGPDKCGLDHKFHFILRYKNKNTGEYEEKHADKVSPDLSGYFSDKKTHLYTLVMRKDNSFERFIDQVSVQKGNLLKDFTPAINPPAEIDDPNDTRPENWDERPTIVDPSAKKPDDWDEDAPEFIIDESATKPEGWLDDEPELVPDPDVQMPADWDTETDGDWEAPMIKNKRCEEAPGCGEWQKPKINNPAYKGKWSAPVITNPAYKGVWQPRKIPNPDFFLDEHPYSSLDPVSAVGMELWSMNDNIVFDNFIITDSLQTAQKFASETWQVKNEAERLADPKAHSVVDAIRENYKERPWLVLAIGLACTLPFVFCFWYIFRTATRTPVAMHKKTDSPTPDDENDDVTEKPKSDKTNTTEGEDQDDETEEDSVGPGPEDDDDDDVVAVDANDATDSDRNEPAQKETQKVQKRRPRKD